MAFAIVAEFPLGLFRGHVAPGVGESWPSVARLHAALVCAAGAGPAAVQHGDDLGPAAGPLAALAWLEENPPDGVRLPAYGQQQPVARAYRNLGLRKTKKIHTIDKPLAGVSALAGEVAWIWSAQPPEDVRATLEDLCREVSHLGTSESPVRLRVGDAESTHVLDAQADLFDPRGEDVELPLPGRARELVDAHGQLTARMQRRPKADSAAQDETEVPPVLPARSTALARYVPAGDEHAPGLLPWSHVLLLPLDRAVGEEWRVSWAVALHRALIAQIGDGAPAVVTGAYGPGSRVPANRVAIQLLPLEAPGHAGRTGAECTALVLVPHDAAASDVAVLVAAAGRLQRVTGPGGRLVRVAGRPLAVAAGDFWGPVPAGHERTWVTSPAVVPETRPPRQGWGLEDAVALSVALTWRDFLPAPPSRAGRLLHWREAAHAAGVRVLTAARLTDGRQSRYVHKVPAGLTVQPLRARVSLGELGADRAVAAVGQSRHLGCGLLLPVDLRVGEVR